MNGGDEALLRQIMGQVGALTAKVEAIGVSLEEKVGERREHANGLEARVVALGDRVRAIELIGAEGKTIPSMVSDHERRIRFLESMRWQILAMAFVGSAVGWVVTNVVLRLP